MEIKDLNNITGALELDGYNDGHSSSEHSGSQGREITILRLGWLTY